ncbi:AAA domain-containing protein [Emericellopsis atlantica]|uniref:AAA domain-containing protein n=1 Tax=Emericellopsis atlantica TaxID=2614577 RepID=A0A9P7ZUT8_9HYPO|nr:AAA domain-containing protein [Emericellopsis atlantica]KAG9258640.1 AAA domain-containing protein [Emericellopsis atlantica]
MAQYANSILSIVETAQRKARVSEFLDLHVRMPMGNVAISAEAASEKDFEGYIKGQYLRVRFSLQGDAQVEVDNWGMPYKNKDSQCEAWLNGDKSVANIRLLDFLQGPDFYITAKRSNNADGFLKKCTQALELEKVEQFPYGEEHFWSIARYRESSEYIKGEQFGLCMRFDDDNAHVSAISQAVVQDQYWVAEEAINIFCQKRPAHAVPKGPEYPEAKFAESWSRLQNQDTDQAGLCFFDNTEDLTVPLDFNVWNWGKDADARKHFIGARVIEAPNAIPVLKNHGIQENDFVLDITGCPQGFTEKDPPLKFAQFASRTVADAALNKDRGSWNTVTIALDPQLGDAEQLVNSVWELREGGMPTNPLAYGVVDKRMPTPIQTFKHDAPTAELKLAMARHREIWSGRGFWRTQLAAANPSLLDTSPEAKLASMSLKPLSLGEREWSLPTADLLPEDSLYWAALQCEVDADDQAQFERHMAQVPLGIAIISAGAGYGKTTRVAVATLSLTDRVKKVYASGPTHIAVNNFVERTDRVDVAAVAYCREGECGDENRVRRFIVRGRLADDNVRAARRLLENPDATEAELFPWQVGRNNRWQLHLSLAYWVLKALGSPAVPELVETDPEAIWELRAQLVSVHGGQAMVDAIKARDWDAIVADDNISGKSLETYMKMLLKKADIVFSTPAMSNKGEHWAWKRLNTAGYAVDEAANMKRADMTRVWGNSSLPIVMAGDGEFITVYAYTRMEKADYCADEQLEPTVMTERNQDAEGRYLNRHFQDGKVSAMQWFKAHGWPVYVLVKQYRMAKGMMDAICPIIYPDVDLVYAPSCDIDQEQHALGILLDQFLRQRFDTIQPAPADRLYPAFLHCPETSTYTNPVTHGKSNSQQCFVQWIEGQGKTIERSQLVIICPYKANLGVLEMLRKQAKYRCLDGVPPAATVDSYQGKEGDLVCVVLGTTRQSTAGFTSNRNRLNVMCTRQRCGLVLVGDVHVMGAVDGVEDAPKPMAKGKGGKARGGKVQRSYTATGEATFSNVTGPLQDLLKWLGAKKRVGILKSVAENMGSKEEL